MKSARRHAREAAVQVLYRYDGSGLNQSALLPAELLADLQAHFGHFQVLPEAREFAALLVAGTLNHRAEIDARVTSLSQNWRLDRLALLDRQILRLGLYELAYTPDTPHQVVIDEYVSLARQFGAEGSAAFINGVLDAAARQVATPSEPA